MAFCTYAEGSAVLGATSVSNLFLMEYMPQAPGDYVKVYLYALLLCRFPLLGDSLEQTADALHMEPEAVLAAFRYWKREGLVEQLSDNPPSFALLPLTLAGAQAQDDGEIYENRSYNRQLQELMPGLVLEAHELRMAADWLDVYKMEPDAVLLIVKTEVERRGGKLPTARTMFRALEKSVRELAENGNTTLSAVERAMALEGASGEVAKQILRRFGQGGRKPTDDELALVKKWLEDWALSREEIMDACGEMVKGTNPSFAYVDGVLTRRRGGASDERFSQVKTLLGHLGLTTRPTPEQLDALERFLGMGFEFAAIEQAAIQCAENNRHSFDDIEKRLARWKEAGALTVEEIAEQRRQQKMYQDFMGEVFERAGLDKRVTAGDIKLAKLWTALIEQDAVLYAAELARGAENPVKYIDKLVHIWSASGATTLEKAKAQSAPAGPRGRGYTKPMDEREVSEDEFKTGFYADVMNRKRPGE
ncbi:MAG: hypothetical protein II697_07120 [Clostridia bacterium]|nr:hypothetical protein [Clostridia bacterium]